MGKENLENWSLSPKTITRGQKFKTNVIPVPACVERYKKTLHVATWVESCKNTL
ncbi:MAG: hypothetical protein ACQES9_11855 [Myxococcota bacterium]